MDLGGATWEPVIWRDGDVTVVDIPETSPDPCSYEESTAIARNGDRLFFTESSADVNTTLAKIDGGTVPLTAPGFTAYDDGVYSTVEWTHCF